MHHEAILSNEAVCLHCGQELTLFQRKSGFCCAGCHAVHSLLSDLNLTRFYDLKPKKFLPLLDYFTRTNDFNWVETLPGMDYGTVELSIEGLQCAACVWLIEEYFRRSSLATAVVDTALGKIHIQFDVKQFNLKEALGVLWKMGYKTSASKDLALQSNDQGLLIRLGICIAIAMNSMFFTFSIYLGMGREAGDLFKLFYELNFYLTVFSVLIGGSYFFTKAYEGLKNRILHFDLPITLGILATFIGSTINHFSGRFQGEYFDTLSIFIALMLLGRFLQNQVLKKNRGRLLSEDCAQDFLVTVIDNTILEKKFSEVKAKEILLIQPGGLIPVDSDMLDQTVVECSLSSINGEAHPKIFKYGATIPSGARLISSVAVRVLTKSDFDGALLSHLMLARKPSDSLPVVWQWVNSWYVILVILIASISFIAWELIDPSRAILVFASVMVVTCPCGIGISIPLARTMANRHLIKRGVFAQSGDFLDKWRKIKNIFCDKTGTLTLATLTVKNPELLEALSGQDLEVLYNAVAHSRHPASQAIYSQLASKKIPWIPLTVNEEVGRGLKIKRGEDNYFIGKPHSSESYAVDFIKNEKKLVVIDLQETILEEAPSVIQKLKKMGKEFYLVSGDHFKSVSAMAQHLHLDSSHVFYDQRPENKSQLIAKYNHDDTLMLGDGLNDAPAFDTAFIAGGPIWEKSGVATKSDFYFASSSLRWLPDIFTIAEKLTRTINFNLIFAALYNILVVSLAITGKMNPVLCAILMPLSSLILIGLTMTRMRDV